MKQFLKFLSCLLLGAMAMPASAQAPEGEIPLVRLHTTHYDLHGDANAFSFIIGASENIWVDIDCGFGATEFEVINSTDPETGSITGSVFSGSVNAGGVVTIYGLPEDADKIDYIDMAGMYIDRLDLSNVKKLKFLKLDHNELAELDLSHLADLQLLSIDDNPFGKSPLVVGPNHPDLTVLSMSILGAIDPTFTFNDYPQLRSVSAWSNPTLKRCEVDKCTGLLQLSIDATDVETLDLSKNPSLLILNISETKITEIDLSGNPYLTEFYAMHIGSYNRDYKMSSVDLSKNTVLQRLFLSGNNLKDVDVTMLTELTSLNLSDNYLTRIDIDNCKQLASLNLANNRFTFATLPADRETFSEYYYYQRPFEMELSYPEGTTLDFTAETTRPGSETYAAVFSISRDNPESPVMLDDEYFTWQDGKLTLNKECADSVYIAFGNTVLPDATLTTTRFMVKSAENFGKPAPTVTVNVSARNTTPSFGVGFAGATPEKPVKFLVDFGDGTLVECSADTHEIPAAPNVTGARKGANTVIYAPEGQHLTALSIENQVLLGVDLKEAPELALLNITGCSLPSIDLSWNRCLSSINLSSNSLTALDLAGANGNYGKNILTDIDASNNRLTEFTVESNVTWKRVNLANNNLTKMPILKAENLEALNIANNSFETLDLRDAEALTTLDVSGNNLSELQLADYVPLKDVNLAGNRFTFATLPPVTRFAGEYTYAPQQIVLIPETAPVVSLIDHYFVTDNDESTEFTWRFESDNSVVTSGIRAQNGRFFFDDPEIGKIYCTMSHPAFPAFKGADQLATTVTETAPMPSNVFATFTVAPGKENGRITLTGVKKGTTVYVDWSGEGDFEQYVLDVMYTTFENRTFPGKQAKCYSYDENEGVTVFSLMGMPVTQVDASKMKNLINFSVQGNGTDPVEIAYPTGSNVKEMSLYNCGITDLSADVAKFTTVEALSAPGNMLGDVDLTGLKSLLRFEAGNSGITSLKFDNPRLFSLSVESNNLSEIDFSNAPAISQMWLSNNSLKSLDVTPLTQLIALYADNNALTFSTLPLPSPKYVVYNYAPQAPVEIAIADGKVDLSSQNTINGVATEYRWFIDYPYLDDNGVLSGEELYVDDEYTVEGGVTTFHSDIDNVMCVMTNSTFPNLYLTSTFVDARKSGVEDVAVEAGNADAEYYNLQGVRVLNPTPGLYIKRTGNTTQKVLIK